MNSDQGEGENNVVCNYGNVGLSSFENSVEKSLLGIHNENYSNNFNTTPFPVASIPSHISSPNYNSKNVDTFEGIGQIRLSIILKISF